MQTKARIEKILKGGSPKQRILLIAESVARDTFGNTPLLTDRELRELSDTFKTDSEIRTYNRVKKQEEAIRLFMLNLQQFRLIFYDRATGLKAYSAIWHTLEQTEDLLNTILHRIEDKKLRKVITEDILAYYFLLTDIKKDKEGYIYIDVGEQDPQGNNLYSLIHNLSEQAKDILKHIKTGIKVCRDFMDAQGLHIPQYNKMLKELESSIIETAKPIFLVRLELLRDTLKELPRPLAGEQGSILGLFDKYYVFPEWDKVEIDQDIYKKYYANNFKAVE